MDLRAVNNRIECVEINFKASVWLSKIFAVALTARIFYCYRAAVLTKSRCAVALIAMVRGVPFYSASLSRYSRTSYQLAVTQFGSASAVAMQARSAGLITNLLRTKINVITVGVSLT